jgi:tetratricopeptide (TPR) repeat protein
MSPLDVDRCVPVHQMRACASRVTLAALSRATLLTAALLLSSIATLHAQASNKAVDDLMNQAQTALSRGKPEEAVSILRRAIDMAPTRAELYLLRSRARDSSGKFDAALEDASKYIELAPDDTYGYLNRARVYLSMERKQAALEDANKAIAMSPNEPDAYFRRADIYTELGKDAEAKADEAKAEELDKKAR